MKRILVYDDTFTSIQTSALELYKSLIEYGFKIDLMLDVSNFVNDESFYKDHPDDIKIIKLFEDKRRFLVSRENALRYYFVRFMGLLSTKMKKALFVKNYSNTINLDDYFCIISTSETSLKMIENIVRGSKPVVYYCTELYSEILLNPKITTSKELKKYIKYKRLKKYVRSADAIVIQDEDRWKILSQSNNLSDEIEHFFYPVSINRYSFENYQISDNLVQEINEKCKDKKIIFYPTVIVPKRGCEQLIDAVNKLPDDYVLLIHGFNGSRSFIDQIKRNSSDKVIISHRSLNYLDLLYLNSIIWCGVLYYGEENYNDRFISNSCNKLVAYLEAGKPFFTFGNRSLEQLVRNYKCGYVINELNQESMVEAVQYINSNYIELSKNSSNCFEDRYDAQKNVAAFCEYLKRRDEND